MENDREEAIEQGTRNAEDMTAVRFHHPASEIAQFDSLTSKSEECGEEIVDAMDKEWFSNHLSTSLTQREGPRSFKDLQDF